jgi:hypothetical protein
LRLNATNINRQKGKGIRGYKVFQPCNPETIKQGIEKVTFRSLASVYAGVTFKQQCVLGHGRRVKAGKRQAPAFRLHWQGRVSPLAVASP